MERESKLASSVTSILLYCKQKIRRIIAIFHYNLNKIQIIVWKEFKDFLLHFHVIRTFIIFCQNEFQIESFYFPRPSSQKYRYLVDFAFCVKEFNGNPAWLPNITLGYHIDDSCGDTRRALLSLLRILSGTRKPVPNYSCRRKGRLVGFIGDLLSEPTISIAHILSVFGYSQVRNLSLFFFIS